MVEIQHCSICKPSYECINTINGRTYFFERADTFVDFPEKIIDCPILRNTLTVEEVEEKQNILTSQSTGETFPDGL